MLVVCIYYLYYYITYIYCTSSQASFVETWERRTWSMFIVYANVHIILLYYICICLLAWRSQYYQEDPVPSSNGNHHHSFVYSIYVSQWAKLGIILGSCKMIFRMNLQSRSVLWTWISTNLDILLYDIDFYIVHRMCQFICLYQ